MKYGTNINLGKRPNNDWAEQLQSAARSAIEKSPEKIQPKLYAKMDKITSAKKPLSAAEREILVLRKDILNKVDRDALKNIQNENIRNFDRNFDYLISSSEITVNQKLYILKKLNYFLSPKYKINKLLADKKTQALAEIVNDMVIDTPESKIPNIKAVNQLSTGVCAAISICRKNLVYEDKANYVDMILSELDDKDYMMIYDISKLGSGKKIPVAKPYIDFDYALKKGFRIIDASALNWMKVADTTGRTNNETSNYVAFDKEYFDTFSDIHLISDINEELSPEQDYYRALLRAKSALKTCKKADIKKKINSSNKKAERKERFDYIQKYSELLTKHLSEIAPQAKPAEIRQLFNGLSSLEAEVSTDIDKCKDNRKPYMYVSNEPETKKTGKIKSYITANIAGAGEISEEKAKDILDLLSSLKELNSNKTYSAAAKRVITAKRLYRAAAAYRVQTDFGLENDYRVCDMLKNLGLPDRETLILQNMDTLAAKLEKGTLNPAIKEILSERFQTEYNDDEALKVAIETNRDNLEKMLTETLDVLYQSCTLPGRKQLLLQNVTAARDAIFENNDGDTLRRVAYDMNMEADKRKICKELDKYIETLSAENLSNEDYTRIYNKMGGRNRMLDFKAMIEELGGIITEDSERAAKIRSELNTANGLPAEAPAEQTLEVYKSIVDNFNAVSTLTSTFQ